MRCGVLNPTEAIFCNACRAIEFREEAPPQTRAPMRLAGARFRLDPGRVALLSVLSFGLYWFYWFYLTWKQLAGETRDQHFPVGHALAQIVPIYNLFRAHKHMSVIRELARGAGVATTLSPGLAVVAVAVFSGLDWYTIGVVERGTLLALTALSVLLSTAVLDWAQAALNRYWAVTSGAEVREVRGGVGEVFLVAVGLLLGLATLLPAE